MSGTDPEGSSPQVASACIPIVAPAPLRKPATPRQVAIQPDALLLTGVISEPGDHLHTAEPMQAQEAEFPVSAPSAADRDNFSAEIPVRKCLSLCSSFCCASERLMGKFTRRWNRLRFALLETSRHARLEIAKDVQFYVPVSGGGVGKIKIGNKTCFGLAHGFRLGSGEISLYTADSQAEILVGRMTYFNNNVSIGAVRRVSIGDNCLIGACAAITDCDFHDISPDTRHSSRGSAKPVTIGNNVWLGEGVTVLKGVEIGDNSVVGAKSVVTKSIPSNCVAAGNPARVIQTLA